MPMTIKLDHHHRSTVEALYRHPIGHNIQWRDVFSLLERFGEVREAHRGGWTCTIDGVVHSLGRARGRDLTEDQVVKIRHLLQSLQVTADGEDAA